MHSSVLLLERQLGSADLKAIAADGAEASFTVLLMTDGGAHLRRELANHPESSGHHHPAQDPSTALKRSMELLREQGHQVKGLPVGDDVLPTTRLMVRRGGISEVIVLADFRNVEDARTQGWDTRLQDHLGVSVARFVEHRDE
ncbi:hypothetical protein [Nocardiopsis alba]|uniref:hypothetical protein n=1 Tax=Nocardiopsis alba TaxID=53437 RepID=UPI0033E24747